MSLERIFYPVPKSIWLNIKFADQNFHLWLEKEQFKTWLKSIGATERQSDTLA